MYILFALIAYFYFTIGAIIGIKLMYNLKNPIYKILFVVAMSFIWLPNIPADIIATNVKNNLGGR